MPAVKAPNGAVMDLPDAVASGLVNGANSEWSYVDAQPATKAPAAPAKPAK